MAKAIAFPGHNDKENFQLCKGCPVNALQRLTVKLPQVVVGMFIGHVTNLLFRHFSEKGMHKTGA